MTLPFRIETELWMILLPLLAALLWALTRPSTHFIKQLGRMLVMDKVQSAVARRPGKVTAEQAEKALPRVGWAGKWLCWLIFISLFAMSSVSFLVWTGAIKNKPRPQYAQVDPNDVELIFGDHSIEGKLKSATRPAGGEDSSKKSGTPTTDGMSNK